MADESVKVIRDCELGLLCESPRCDCTVTGIILTPEQARYLYDNANSYDSRIPAETHRPLWIYELEKALTMTFVEKQSGGES